MRDKIFLQIDNMKIEHFLSYSVHNHLFNAADSFSMELMNPKIKIKEGARCKLYVNDRLELNGIVERIAERYDKAKRSLTIEGRDLMGLVADSYVEDFFDLKDHSLKDIAQRLLKNIPFINRKKIIYAKGSKERSVSQDNKELTMDVTSPSPGDRVFEVLARCAMSHGLLFFSLPDGTFVFGKPRARGNIDFVLVCRKDVKGNNILEAERVRDIKAHFSKVTVTGDRQGRDNLGVDDLGYNVSVEDKSYPFYKPKVLDTSYADSDPESFAKLEMKHDRFEGLLLNYKTFAHSQNGKNYQVNDICHVEDEVFGISGNYLIYARTFKMSKNGVFTDLNLSRLGILPK